MYSVSWSILGNRTFSEPEFRYAFLEKMYILYILKEQLYIFYDTRIRYKAFIKINILET